VELSLLLVVADAFLVTGIIVVMALKGHQS
jgi:hypothetical protein